MRCEDVSARFFGEGGVAGHLVVSMCVVPLREFVSYYCQKCANSQHNAVAPRLGSVRGETTGVGKNCI